MDIQQIFNVTLGVSMGVVGSPLLVECNTDIVVTAMWQVYLS